MIQALKATAAGFRTVTAYIVISLYVLIVGPPALLFAIAFKSPTHLYPLSAFGVWLGLTITGIRHVRAGDGAVLRDRPAMYCVNHASNIEPPLVFLVVRPLFPHLSMIYKKEMRKLPILGRVLEVAGFVPIDRADREQSAMAIEQAANQLHGGRSFVVFPEGTRSRTGELLPFKKGAFILAIKAQVPVVPVAMIGARGAMRKGSPFIWPTTVTVRVGRPIETAGMTHADRDMLMDHVRSEIAAMLEAGPAFREAAPRTTH